MRKTWFQIFLTIVLILIPMQIWGGKLFDKAGKKQLAVYLQDICRWAMEMKFSAWPAAQAAVGRMEGLAVQGSLGRTLMAAGELTKDGSKYVDEALAWGDALVGKQQRMLASRGGEAGYWMDAKGNIEILENCMAAGALGRISEGADGNRKKGYQQAMERLARILLEGSDADPSSKKPAVKGWISAQGAQGAQKGAWGSGILNGSQSLQPSTRATAAAAFFFAELFGQTRNKQYRDIALDAVAWLMKSRRPNGEFPEVVDGKEAEELSYVSVVYCTDAILSAFYLLGDSTFNQRLPVDLENTTRQFMRVQGEKGIWGEGLDRYGSMGVSTLLAWYYSNPPNKPDESIPQSLDKFWQLLSNPVHAQSFGIFANGMPTAFLGLTTAEMIKPGITFKKL